MLILPISTTVIVALLPGRHSIVSAAQYNDTHGDLATSEFGGGGPGKGRGRGLSH
ncbi:hypothetical protein [Streptomyces sp. TS71-3]|uniref:hypothetical protein n=1 Tax=Streptomyces sp. TS71-3 TaxID=2733862 RepID=UPI001BB3CFBB|nr:hypothetical protein [Streptomyces sp. TS71-3]